MIKLEMKNYNTIHCTKKHIFFFKIFWKDDPSKKIALEYDHSCIIRKDDISFPQNMTFFLLTENERWDFSKNTWKYDAFCMLVKVVFLFPKNMKLHFCQKSKEKYTQIHLYFYGDLFKCFNILLSNKKNRKLNL